MTKFNKGDRVRVLAGRGRNHLNLFEGNEHIVTNSFEGMGREYVVLSGIKGDHMSSRFELATSNLQKTIEDAVDYAINNYSIQHLRNSLIGDLMHNLNKTHNIK